MAKHNNNGQHKQHQVKPYKSSPPDNSPVTPYPIPQPPSQGDGQDGGDDANTCQMVCMPTQQYNLGSQPAGHEGMISGYATPYAQNVQGAGRQTDQAYLQNYVAQEQAYENNWDAWASAMQNGTTPAPVQTTPQATTPFSDYLVQNGGSSGYGY